MRVAVVAGPAPGHAFPAVALAIALRAAGVDVVVVTGGEWLPAVRREGLDGEELPALADNPRGGDFGYLLWGRSEEMARPLAGLLTAGGVDAVVADTLTVAGGFAAELCSLPYVELVPHPLSDPSRALPPTGTGLRPGRTPAGRTRDAVLRWLAARSRALGARQRAAARAALGLPPDGAPALRLVATVPGLEPPRPDWPLDARIVGPLEWDPAIADLAPPPGDAPLVVLVASTATGAPAGLAALAIDALAGCGLRLAVIRFDAEPGPLPRWVVAGSVRQAPLLAEAVRSGGAVLCGAGHGMVAKALVRGLPLVLVPAVGDQLDNAERVVTAGAGVAVPARRLDAARLRAGVRRVVGDPGYARAAARLGATADGLGPAYAARVALDALRRPMA